MNHREFQNPDDFESDFQVPQKGRAKMQKPWEMDNPMTPPDRQINVLKFGGSSVGTLDRIRNVARRVAREREHSGRPMVIVVSAMGDTTDEHLGLAREILPEDAPHRELDVVLATGEQLAIALTALAIIALGIPAVSFTGWQIGLRTTSNHTRARILSIDDSLLRRELAAGRVVVVAGNQGLSDQREITTLGRGGSDLTAIAIAAALGLPVCDIYTDVDGVYSADPRLVAQARKLPSASPEVMLTLAAHGAQIMQTAAVEYARHRRVAIHIRSSTSDETGTLIAEPWLARQILAPAAPANPGRTPSPFEPDNPAARGRDGVVAVAAKRDLSVLSVMLDRVASPATPHHTAEQPDQASAATPSPRIDARTLRLHLIRTLRDAGLRIDDELTPCRSGTGAPAAQGSADRLLLSIPSTDADEAARRLRRALSAVVARPAATLGGGTEGADGTIEVVTGLAKITVVGDRLHEDAARERLLRDLTQAGIRPLHMASDATRASVMIAEAAAAAGLETAHRAFLSGGPGA